MYLVPPEKPPKFFGSLPADNLLQPLMGVFFNTDFGNIAPLLTDPLPRKEETDPLRYSAFTMAAKLIKPDEDRLHNRYLISWQGLENVFAEEYVDLRFGLIKAISTLTLKTAGATGRIDVMRYDQTRQDMIVSGIIAADRKTSRQYTWNNVKLGSTPAPEIKYLELRKTV